MGIAYDADKKNVGGTYQVKLKDNTWKSGNPHRIKMDALLRGMIYCSCCGSGMYSTYSANKERRD